MFQWLGGLAGGAFVLGLVCLIHPMQEFRISTRRRALAVMGISSVVFVAAVAADSIMGSAPSQTEPLFSATAADDPNDPPVSGSASETSETRLGVWEIDYNRQLQDSLGLGQRADALVYRNGAMIIETRYGDNDPWAPGRTVVERPSGYPGIRRFDLDPDNAYFEYVTVSEEGVLTRFAWEGRELYDVNATTFHPDAMSIGFNPVERPCTPMEFSGVVAETLRLYRELHTFKDDPEFAIIGFGGLVTLGLYRLLHDDPESTVNGLEDLARSSPYRAWLEAVRAAMAEAERDNSTEPWELYFSPIVIMNLGQAYNELATYGSGPRASATLAMSTARHIQRKEREIQAFLHIATCGAQPD